MLDSFNKWLTLLLVSRNTFPQYIPSMHFIRSFRLTRLPLHVPPQIVYLASLIRGVTSLHDLVNNKVSKHRYHLFFLSLMPAIAHTNTYNDQSR